MKLDPPKPESSPSESSQPPDPEQKVVQRKHPTLPTVTRLLHSRNSRGAVAELEDLLRRAGIDEPDMTELEVAELERVKVRTVREWRQKGTGPPYRKLGPGKMAPVRYPVKQYREWRASTITGSTANSLRPLGRRR